MWPAAGWPPPRTTVYRNTEAWLSRFLSCLSVWIRIQIIALLQRGLVCLRFVLPSVLTQRRAPRLGFVL